MSGRYCKMKRGKNEPVVRKDLFNKENEYNLCRECSRYCDDDPDFMCEVVESLESIMAEVGGKAIVWECEDFVLSGVHRNAEPKDG